MEMNNATVTPKEMSNTPAAATTTPTAATPSAPKPRKLNAWISHVKQFRLDNADKIKTGKLSCGQISKMARETYKPRAKCATCGK